MPTNSADVDPVMLEVIWQRLISIVTEQMISVTRTAFSPILREAGDLGTAIFDARGRMLVHGDTGTPGHIIPMMGTVKYFFEEFPPDTLEEGDVLITNDPWRVAGHLFDIAVATPIFHEKKLVAIAMSLAHHGDIGGRGYGPHANDVYEEGLFIPAAKIIEKHKLNDLLARIIRANVREPDILFGDLNSQITGNQVALERISDLLNEYELNNLESIADQIISRSEDAARKVIAQVPDGKYSAAIKVDGYDQPLDVVATVTVKGDSLNVDFAGSSPQSPRGINVCLSYTAGYVAFALRCALGRDIPTNHGSLAPLTVTSPEGTVVNCKFPAPVAARTITVRRIISVMMGALAQAFPNRVPAACDGQSNYVYVGGIDPKAGRRYVAMLGVPTSGGMGGRPGKDGIDVISSDASNIVRYPVEAFETDTPYRVKHLNLWTDSAGPGEFRGGLGYHAEIELLRGDATMTHRRDRHDFAPWGLMGGHAAPCCKTVLHRADGSNETLPSKAIRQIAAGDRIEIFTSGGGGFGDPLRRPAVDVLADVKSGRVSMERAREDYGVVIDNGAADQSATAQLRAEMAARQSDRAHLFDRGPEYAARFGVSQHEGSAEPHPGSA